jgi:site-specific recombinase XerD
VRDPQARLYHPRNVNQCRHHRTRIERLTAAAKKDTRRHTHRDATMILIAYRHGLKASELVGVR